MSINAAPREPASATSAASGFSLIELMIVVSTFVIVLTMALPVYSTYSIRSNVGKALDMATAAKTATAHTCAREPGILILDNAQAGYHFAGSAFLGAIMISGPCSAPVIALTTRNSGAPTDPVVLVNGELNGGPGRFRWTCRTANGQDHYLPSTCRG